MRNRAFPWIFAALGVAALCLVITGCKGGKRKNAETTSGNGAPFTTSDSQGAAAEEHPSPSVPGVLPETPEKEEKTDSARSTAKNSGEETQVSIETGNTDGGEDGNTLAENTEQEKTETQADQTESGNGWDADGDGYYDIKIH